MPDKNKVNKKFPIDSISVSTEETMPSLKKVMHANQIILVIDVGS
jgi:hypothetical protein